MIKYLNYNHVYDIITQNPRATIQAGTQDDWKYTSSTLWDGNNLKFKKGCYVFSNWDEPTIKINMGNKTFTQHPYTTEQQYSIPTYSGETVEQLELDLLKFNQHKKYVDLKKLIQRNHICHLY